MAASSENVSSATETLNSMDDEHQTSITQPISSHDSTSQPQEQPVEAKSSDPVPIDDTNSSGKRKRDDDAEPAEEKQDLESSRHPLWKTSLCSYFRGRSGVCSHGDECRFAHSEEELQARPDNTWDPTSERAKKKLNKSENGEKMEVSDLKESGDGEILMTEAFDDDDGDNGSSDHSLSKCLVHLPMKWHSDHLRKFLDEQGVLYKSAKKKKGMVVGFVSFGSAEQAKSATEVLNGTSIGNKSLMVADVVPRSFEKKTTLAVPLPQSAQQTTSSALASVDTEDGDRTEDGSTLEGSVSTGRSARDVVTPLAHMPYEDQLEHKKNSLTQILRRLPRHARKACPNGVSLPEWILKSREIGGLPCQLEGILGSPLVNGYRNKCEFSVGYSLQGKLTVGYLLGNFRAGVTAVEEPLNCPNVSTIACKYASIFQEFLQHSSFPIWNRFNNTGFWRQLTVREGRKPGRAVEVENAELNISEVMLIVQVCTVGIDDEIVNSELERMAQAFTAGAASSSPSLPLTTLVVQDHRGISNVAPADAPLRTIPIPIAESDSSVAAANNVVEARIHDYINNLRFCISPAAFFQVNTLGAEKLYSLAGDWAGLGPDTLLFDICCGTGTIGLNLAHRVGMVVGIEMNASAVSDAHRNAEINGIKNCRFVCAKAEDVMRSLLKEYLNVAPKQDEISNATESNDKETKEKDVSTENVLGPEESSAHELESGKGASECSENGRQEPINQPQKNHTTEGGPTSLQQFENVVVIVDPPRAGLHPTVIKALRTHPRLRRLVYISCNPESLVANAIELCTPSADKTEKVNKNNRGWRNMGSVGLARHRAKSMPSSEPFQPVKAMAVDLFPHTPHCELVMLLERQRDSHFSIFCVPHTFSLDKNEVSIQWSPNNTITEKHLIPSTWDKL